MIPERNEMNKGFEVIFHLAAYAAQGLSHFVRAFNYTNAVYGAGQLPMTEDPYGVAKYAVELDLEAITGCSVCSRLFSGRTMFTAKGKTSGIRFVMW